MRSSIASGEKFPDALVAGALGSPVLLTQRDAVPGPLAEHLANRTYMNVMLYGGTYSISAAVEAQLRVLVE